MCSEVAGLWQQSAGAAGMGYRSPSYPYIGYLLVPQFSVFSYNGASEIIFYHVMVPLKMPLRFSIVLCVRSKYSKS